MSHESSPKDLSDDALWTAEDVAQYIQASRSWVYQKAEAGLLPCLRVGGLLRFDPLESKRMSEESCIPRWCLWSEGNEK